MREFTTSDAKSRLGELLDAAQAEPVLVRRNGCDVAVVLSVADYVRLTGGQPAASPAVKTLHAASTRRFAKAYGRLAE